MASEARAAIALALALALTARTALADPTPEQKELARGLMQRGRDARQAHDDKQAFESFKAADDIMHVPTTGFEVARSQADLGQLVEAHETLQRVMLLPERPDDSQGFRDARGYAKVLDDELLQRIPQLRIAVDGGPTDGSLRLSVDGVALPPAAQLVPYKVDPGHHVVLAGAGGAEGRAEVDVQERETKDVAVHAGPASPAPATVAAPSPPASASLPPATPPPATPPPTPDAAGSSGRAGGLGTITWIGGGVAAAGVIVGSITGALAISDNHTLSSECNGPRCPPSANGTLQSANGLATASTVSFVVAGAGAGLALAGFLWLRPAPTATSGVRVTPWIGLEAAGLDGAF
jgi:hypothetical protein